MFRKNWLNHASGQFVSFFLLNFRPGVRPDVRAAPVSSEEKKKRGEPPPGYYNLSRNWFFFLPRGSFRGSFRNPSAKSFCGSFRKCLFRIENPSAESFRKDPSAKIGQQKSYLFFWILPQPSAKSFRGTLPQMLILHWKSFRGILPQNPSAKNKHPFGMVMR